MSQEKPIQNPLTSLMPIKTEKIPEIKALLETQAEVIAKGLAEVGTVHFARIFLFGDGNIFNIPGNILALITSYDNSFADYIQAFVNNNEIAKLFDVVLGAVDIPGASDLIPVQKNAQAFAELVAKYDATNVNRGDWGLWFSAYPKLKVQEILALAKEEKVV